MKVYTSAIFLIVACEFGLHLSKAIPIDDSLTPSKRDAFMSRGWAAGGMPFSVLYLNQPGSQTGGDLPIAQSSRDRKELAPIAMSQKQMPSYQDQLPIRGGYSSNTSAGLKPFRRPYSAIPQLFVSYGWGPLGK